MKKLATAVNAMLAAAFEARAARRAPSRRDGVRVTTLVQGCARLVAFECSEHARDEQVDPAAMMRMELGMRLEGLGYDVLEEAGWRVERRQEDVICELGGVPVRGRLDGVVTTAPLPDFELPAIVDVKTADGETVRKYVTAPSRVPASYRLQINLYQHATGLHAPGWLVFVARSEPFGVAAVPVQYDELRIAELEQVLISGWENRVSPRAAPPPDYAAEDRPPCSFCRYREVCYGVAQPAVRQ